MLSLHAFGALTSRPARSRVGVACVLFCEFTRGVPVSRDIVWVCVSLTSRAQHSPPVLVGLARWVATWRLKRMVTLWVVYLCEHLNSGACA